MAYGWVRVRARVPGLGIGCLDVEGGQAIITMAMTTMAMTTMAIITMAIITMAMLTSADIKSKEERVHTLASSAASHVTPSHAAMRATLRGRSSACLG